MPLLLCHPDRSRRFGGADAASLGLVDAEAPAAPAGEEDAGKAGNGHGQTVLSLPKIGQIGQTSKRARACSLRT